MVADEMVWDLSQLVESMVVEAGKLREQYHGKIAGLDAKGVLNLLDQRDALYLRFEGVVNYCNLMYGADSTDAVAKQLNDAVRSATMTATVKSLPVIPS
jgi:oligoendopeptidase F